MPHTNEEMREKLYKLWKELRLEDKTSFEEIPAVIQIENFINQEISDLKKSIREEMIICSAIRMHDGYIIRGHRHNDCLRTASEIPRYGFKKKHAVSIEQGFMTSNNEFVGRKIAWQIAEKSGQILEREDQKAGTLFSEDLY